MKMYCNADFVLQKGNSMKEHILDFIYRRFHGEDNKQSVTASERREEDNADTTKWLSGNCFYFAVILCARFPQGIIYYDRVNGHFVTKIEGLYYDWTGVVDVNEEDLVNWNNYYDISHKERIVRDCIL